MNLQTTKCECGHEFTRLDIKPPLQRTPRGFYGGNVTRISDAICECGRKYQLWLKQIPNSWRVVTIAATSKPESELPEIATAELERNEETDASETNEPWTQEQVEAHFESLDKEQLKDWLDQHGVEYVPQWGEKRMRETALAFLSKTEDNGE